MIKKVFGCN